MADTATERAQAVQTALQASAGNDPGVQRLAVQAVIPQPAPADTGRLWFALVIGLLVLVAIALGGVIFLLADNKEGTSPDLAITAFSSLLTGLIGLFAPSPAGAGNAGNGQAGGG